jgi:hypothetical protein
VLLSPALPPPIGIPTSGIVLRLGSGAAFRPLARTDARSGARCLRTNDGDGAGSG